MRFLFFLIMLVFLSSSCDKENTPDVDVLYDNKTTIDIVFNDEQLEKYEIEYLDNTLNKLSFSNNIQTFGFSYERISEDGLLTGIIQRNNSQSLTEEKVVIYEVEYKDAMISLTSNDSGRYEFYFGGEYLDRFLTYFGDEEQFYYETKFTRNADDELILIEHYATNEDGEEIVIFRHDLHNHTDVEGFFDFVNPSYNFPLGTYTPYFAPILGLKLSSKPALTSDYTIYGEEKVTDHILANVISNEMNVITLCSYTVSDLSFNDYRLEFLYE